MAEFVEHIGSNKVRETKFGGDYRDRTDDPLLAKQVLSQLSYAPLQASAVSLQPSDKRPDACMPAPVV